MINTDNDLAESTAGRMIQRMLWIVLILGIVGCSAIELNEQNQEATAQAEANIASTVDSQFATQSADRPLLVSPDNNAELDDNLTLEWSYTRALDPDESFRVLIAPEGFPLAPLTTTQSTTTDISDYVTGNPADSYHWQVQVVTLDDENEITEQTASPSDIGTFSVADVQSVDVTATLASLYEQATTEAETIDEQISATLTAIAEVTDDPETTPDPESTAEVTPEPQSVTVSTSAEIVIFGSVPIDSDSLNSVTALTLDNNGNLLVSLRNGDIYRLVDEDNDDEADEVTLIFEDSEDDIGQVSGILTDGDLLYIVSGETFSVVQDSDNDGVYDTVTELSDDLPDAQALLQANNSIIRADDGRYITADVNTGDILFITLSDN